MAFNIFSSSSYPNTAVVHTKIWNVEVNARIKADYSLFYRGVCVAEIVSIRVHARVLTAVAGLPGADVICNKSRNVKSL